MGELVIRIVGSPGDGVISSGDILTLAAARSGRYVSTYRSFPTEIRFSLLPSRPLFFASSRTASESER